MAVQKSQEKLSREEITEILRTNAELYGRDEEFVDYIVDLAVYLLEFHYESFVDLREKAARSEGAPTPSPDAPAETQRVPDDLRSPGAGEGALSRRYNLLKSLPRDSAAPPKPTCIVCGMAIAKNAKRCPNCGNSIG